MGLTSTQALGKVRWLLNAEKAGHGGTLDPLASGLLPIALGEATKTIPWSMDGVKTYQFTVQWGAETSTDDLEGQLVATSNEFIRDSKNNLLPRNMEIAAMQHSLQQVLPAFNGALQQKPPAYSALKVGGERAYDLARAGEEVNLAARTVQIDRLSVVDWPSPSRTTFEVVCGKGTYVRSLARDLGRALGWLGHVVMLRRLAVGPFREADMISLEKLSGSVPIRPRRKTPRAHPTPHRDRAGRHPGTGRDGSGCATPQTWPAGCVAWDRRSSGGGGGFGETRGEAPRPVLSRAGIAEAETTVQSVSPFRR